MAGNEKGNGKMAIDNTKTMVIEFMTVGNLLDKMDDPEVDEFEVLEIAVDMNPTKMRELATNHGFAIDTRTGNLMRPKSTTYLHFIRYA